MLIFSVFVLAVATVVAFHGYEKHKENQVVAREIQALQEEARQLESETQRLSERIAYLKTPEYAEREVKEKLNLKKPEESVAIVDIGRPIEKKQEDQMLSPESGVRQVQGVESERVSSNPQKWVAYFFGVKSQ